MCLLIEGKNEGRHASLSIGSVLPWHSPRGKLPSSSIVSNSGRATVGAAGFEVGATTGAGVLAFSMGTMVPKRSLIH